MTEPEAKVFRETIARCDATHFRESDIPLLEAWSQAVLMRRYAFKLFTEEQSLYSFQLWQQSTRTLTSLATKLRLCPHSRSDPKTITRRGGGPGVSYYDLMEDE